MCLKDVSYDEVSYKYESYKEWSYKDVIRSASNISRLKTIISEKFGEIYKIWKFS